MTVDAEAIAELFAAFGPVLVRRMFSGAGLYSEGVFFAIVIDGVIYLKADDETSPRFAAEGCGRFSYTTRQRVVETNLWRMPERLYDDPEELADWAQQACAAARRASAKRKKPRAKSAAQNKNITRKNPAKKKAAGKPAAKSKAIAGKKKAKSKTAPRRHSRKRSPRRRQT